MEYPEQLFIYCNENDDYSWDCNEGETWIGEVQYILQSEYDTLTATIAQKDAEIERLKKTLHSIRVELTQNAYPDKYYLLGIVAKALVKQKEANND